MERSTFLKSVCFDKSCSCRRETKKKFERVLCCVDGAKVALRTNYLFLF